MKPAGELAIVLHTHMPYVEGGARWPPEDYGSFLRNPEGFGTWPFGEEWLWEAIATSYLPLLDVLERAPITLSLTPVLGDQLEAPGSLERCLRFLREVRPHTHARDIDAFRKSGEQTLAAELERSAADYAAAAERLEALGGDLLSALAPHASWTSAATHAVLPLLATDAAVAAQVETGIASHRRRFGAWAGGFWLPECAHAPWLDPLLEEAGARATCVELTGALGLGDRRHLTPLVTDDGPVLCPIDRATMALVWSDSGYPAHPAYRNYHGLTSHHHRAWANDGRPYDRDVAGALTHEHARDFVARARARVAGGGLCVCALDTELLGHWWHEGVAWLDAVVTEAASQSLVLTTLDDALTRHEPIPAPEEDELGVTSWGEGGDLRTWSAPPVARLAWRARSAELRVEAAGERATDRAVRELLALQASDWAFLLTRRSAGDYPSGRADAHADALARALADGAAGGVGEQALRGLAPDLTRRLY